MHPFVVLVFRYDPFDKLRVMVSLSDHEKGLRKTLYPSWAARAAGRAFWPNNPCHQARAGVAQYEKVGVWIFGPSGYIAFGRTLLMDAIHGSNTGFRSAPICWNCLKRSRRVLRVLARIQLGCRRIIAGYGHCHFCHQYDTGGVRPSLLSLQKEVAGGLLLARSLTTYYLIVYMNISKVKFVILFLICGFAFLFITTTLLGTTGPRGFPQPPDSVLRTGGDSPIAWKSAVSRIILPIKIVLIGPMLPLVEPMRQDDAPPPFVGIIFALYWIILALAIHYFFSKIKSMNPIRYILPKL